MKIVNVILTAQLNKVFNLKDEYEKGDLTYNYKPGRFSGLIIKPKIGSVTLFSNGHLNILGSKSIEDGHKVARKMAKKLDGKLSDIKVVNIVVTEKVNRLNLVKLYEVLRSEKYSVRYEPELLAALVTKINGITAIVFHTGSINLTGGREIEKIETVLEFLKNLFKMNHIFFE